MSGMNDNAATSHDPASDHLLDELAVAPATAALGRELDRWRESSLGDVAPDDRLNAMFAGQVSATTTGWRTWLRRPAVAFAASFVGVLVLGAGALALIVDGDSADPVAGPSSTAPVAALASAPSEIVLPQDLSEQTGYAECLFSEVSGWFASGATPAEAPRFVDTCGLPPIPDLGADAEGYRIALQEWANCAATELQAALPELSARFSDTDDLGASVGDDFLEVECGSFPDPAEFGVELPFIDMDWDEFDPSVFGIGPITLGDDFTLNLDDLESLDLEGLLGQLGDEFDWEELRRKIDEMGLDLEGCHLDRLTTDGDGDGETLPDCDLTFIFGEDLDPSELLEGLEGIDLGELLEGFDLEGFANDMSGEELDRLLQRLLNG